jgi:hypothetical protein
MLFKKMQLNFQLHYFYEENETAMLTKVWYNLIDQLLMTVLQKKAKTNKTFLIVSTQVCIHLISKFDIFEMLLSTHQSFEGNRKAPQMLDSWNFTELKNRGRF